MRAAMLFLSSLVLLPYALADDAKPRAGRLPVGCEVVMRPGMKITATTTLGTITIVAVDELTRSYTWDGATRSIELSPRTAKYHGSLGLFHVAQGEHWRDHHGITRCFTEEGQQHFDTVDEAMKWTKGRGVKTFVYRDDGLMVGWGKFPGKKLSVEVWQILIDGKKPERLPGSQDDKIVVKTVETEAVPLVKAVASNDLKSVQALLAKGADANVKNSVDIPVLVMAIRRGSVPIIEALLAKGADPNVRDIDTDLPPLWEALSRGEVDRTAIVKMLVTAGADVNASSRREGDPLMGVTPLMIVAVPGGEDLVQLFLDKGADVNARTPSGITALKMAEISGLEDNKGVIHKLEAAGAKR
jgi:hypothetical protein